MKTQFFIILVFLSFSTASATIINVPGDYPTIQYGINASLNGDTVLVQPGTYVENINFNGHNIVLGSLFLTTGDTSYISTTIIDGDSAGSVVIFENDADSTAVISGLTIRNGWISSSLYGGGITCNALSRPKIIQNIITDNFSDYDGGGIFCYYSNPTITNNTILGNIGDDGAGIYCFYSHPTISDNIISENSSRYHGGGINCRYSNPVIFSNIISGNISEITGGGGIYCTGSNPLITNNTINGNLSNSRGGGIYCSNSDPMIHNNTISGNSSSGGGGIYCSHSNPSISDNTISENSSTSSGGGIRCIYDSNPAIINNTISENHAYSIGGGIYCNYQSNPIIANNIITDNIAQNSWGGGLYSKDSEPIVINNCLSFNFAGDYGGGIFVDSNSALYLINTIFWGNNAGIMGNEIYLDDFASPLIIYCNIQDTLWPGLGNISIDPLYRDPVNGDFHLMSTTCGDSLDSPCIDAGNPYILDSLLDCSWGLGTIISDMGAYGGSDSISGNIINVPGDYPTIQLAINESNDGDTVLVHPGMYSENINFNGHNIVVGSMFMMTGDNSYISSTIIDGSDSASVVTFDGGEDNTARILGFTIQNGWGNHGGGIYCYDSNPAISNNIISENSVYSFGGGILFMGSSSIFSNNLVVDNSANQGGGICCLDAEPIVINNTISGNSADSSGGGVFCNQGSNPIIVNTILWEDSAVYGPEIDHDYSSYPNITYCDVQGGWTGTGNIDIDPLFRNPEGSDFHLKSVTCNDSANSPCIDVGSPFITDSLLDCSWGLETITSDIGAYGGGYFTIVGINDDIPPIPSQLILKQNYPNPFNVSTIIQYSLPEASDVKIEIYDILGRQVKTILDEHKQAGAHTITFDASGLSSGVYFYRLQAGDMVETKRMVLLK